MNEAAAAHSTCRSGGRNGLRLAPRGAVTATGSAQPASRGPPTVSQEFDDRPAVGNGSWTNCPASRARIGACRIILSTSWVPQFSAVSTATRSTTTRAESPPAAPQGELLRETRRPFASPGGSADGRPSRQCGPPRRFPTTLSLLRSTIRARIHPQTTPAADGTAGLQDTASWYEANIDDQSHQHRTAPTMTARRSHAVHSRSARPRARCNARAMVVDA